MQHAKTPLAPTSVFVRMASMETEKQPVVRWVGVHNETKFISEPLCYASRYLTFSLQVFSTSTTQALLFICSFQLQEKVAAATSG